VSAKIIKFKPRPTPASYKRPAPPKKKAAPRLTESVRALRALQHETDVFESCMLWLGQIAQRGVDPRALEAMIDDVFDDYFDNLDASVEMIEEFAAAWRRRMMRGKKPRPVR
jgi:hypothetical protein